ncbi:MAG: hypothetical protein ABI837_05105 [Acidobacteriota bacterium]
MRTIACIKTAVAFAAAVFTISAAATEFETVYHAPDTAYLMTAVGEVFVVHGTEPLRRLFIFSDTPTRPHPWHKKPTGLTQWKSEWLVANNTGQLTRFDMKGMFLGYKKLPAGGTILTASGHWLWVIDILATSPVTQTWRSTDGTAFTPFNLMNSSDARLVDQTQNLMVLSGTKTGTLFAVSIIGPPVIHRIDPPQTRRDIRAAYSRTRSRSNFEKIEGMIDDVTHYSLPVRDMVSSDNGELIALRNREDVKRSTGGTELLLGRRADRYDATGRQVATAVFSRSVHWIVSATLKTVTGVSRSGDVVTATWDRALPGEIIAQ